MSVRAGVFPGLALLYAAFFAATEHWFERAHPTMEFIVPLVASALVVGAVFAALEHAEVVGARVGEPLGTLILTIAVTIIEVSIMVEMIRHGADDPTEASETVFSAVMIVCNGLVGLCLLLGGFQHGEQQLQPMGASAYLAVLIALSTLTLVVPNYTVSSYGPTLAPTQLAFVSVLSILLYGSFLFIQTVRHRSYFLDSHLAATGLHGHKPSAARTLVALIGLCMSLLGVSLLAQRFVPSLEEALAWSGVAEVNPVSGAIVASLVLLPEVPQLHSSGPPQRPADESQRCARLRCLNHWTDRSRGRAHEPRDGAGNRHGARPARRRHAHADAHDQRRQFRLGPHQRLYGPCASRRLCDIWLLPVRPLKR